MRLSAEEKSEIIRLVVNSPEGINKSLRSLGIHKRTFYNWYHAYSKEGIDGLRPRNVLPGNGIGFLTSSVNSL